MKKILVPCDFSSQAVNAYRSALSVAAVEEAEIHLLHVVEVPVLHDAVLMPVLSFEEGLFKELQERAEEQFRRIAGEITSRPGLVKTFVSFGATSRMILEQLKADHYDLIIMGTQGVTGLREVLIGSNTEKIVRNSPVPVLVVHKDLSAAGIKNIVVPTGLEDGDQEEFFTQLKAMQHFFRATLHLVWINTPTRFATDAVTKKQISAFATRYLLKDFTVNVYNDVFEENGIVNFAIEAGADMIAMATHGRKGLAHLFAGSIAEDIANHYTIPLWTYNLKAEKQPAAHTV